MRVHLFAAASTMALAAGASVMVAAPGQTRQPGQMTQARVWVQNRGRSEAVPMELSNVNLDEQPVHLLGGQWPRGGVEVGDHDSGAL